MLTLALIALGLSAFACIGANPLASKGAASDRANHLDGKPQCITVKNAAGETALVSYDVETIEEWKAKGFNAISPAEQTAIDVAAARAARAASAQAPILSAEAAKQAALDDADWPLARAWVLAAFRKQRDAEAKAAAAK